MANNYIEEFFISIGFDTKKVKKEAGEIEKILEELGKKREKPLTEEAKLKKKLHLQNKKDQADNFKFFLATEKSKARALKQAEDKVNSKVAPNKFSDQQKAQKLNDNLLKGQFKQQKGIAKEEAANLRKSAANLKKEAENLRKRELSVGIDRKGANNLHKSIKNSPTYMKAKYEGTLGSYGEKMDAAASMGQVEDLRRLQYQLRRTGTETRKLAAENRKLNMTQKGVVDSTRNMIRSYASVFALFQGTVAIKRIGQDFQGIEASMLAASGSAPAAAKDMKFIDNIVNEMGLNLKDTADAFVKFKFSMKGKMSDGQMEELFKGVSMFGTALKVAPESIKRAQKALIQMGSKGKISAEELKEQLGDSLPGAIQIFSKALNITDGQLFKMMEDGQLFAKDVLPKVAKGFIEAANAGGAYQKSLEGLRVTEGQLGTDLERAGKSIFISGFEEGLSKLYKTLSDILRDSGPQLEKLGRIFGAVFKGIAYSLRLVEPIMKVFIDNFELIFGSYALVKISTMGAALKTFGVTAAASFTTAFAPIFAAVAALGIIEDFTAGKDEAMTKLSVKEIRQGYQTNLYGQVSEITKGEDGNYYKGTTTESKGLFGISSLIEDIVSGRGLTPSAIYNRENPTKVEVVVTGLPSYLNTTIKGAVDMAWSGGMVDESG